MPFIVGLVAISGLIAYWGGINFVTVIEYIIGGGIFLWLAWIVICAVLVFTPMGDKLPKSQKLRFRGNTNRTPSIEPPNTRRREDTGHEDAIRIDNTRVTIQFRAKTWNGQRGEITTRTISPFEMKYYTDRKGITVPTAIEAYCELRGEQRTFRYRRILNAYDPVTGEVIENLGQYLWERRR
ncbi:hypothetical protein Gbfr_022_032 [Gluconobacter frateurii M-2]|nr:hypothetical protein Gbfr_022_032 [Gluconobacter frateurii M-2]